VRVEDTAVPDAGAGEGFVHPAEVALDGGVVQVAAGHVVQ